MTSTKKDNITRLITTPDQKNPRQGTVTQSLAVTLLVPFYSGSKKSPSGDCDKLNLDVKLFSDELSGSKKSPSGDCDPCSRAHPPRSSSAPDQKNPRQGTVTQD